MVSEPVFTIHYLENDINIWEGNGFSDMTNDIPLVDIILQYEEYRILYENYLEEFIMAKYYDFDTFTSRFDTIESIYGDEFDMLNDKEYYITTKIDEVLEDLEYYRNERES